MEKVSGSSYYVVAAIPSSVTGSGAPGAASGSPASLASLERGAGMRGMHSGVQKAVEAHRMMVEERQNRKVVRDRGVDMFEAQQPNDLVVAQKVQQGSDNVVADIDVFENTLIEPAASEAKSAAVQAFQSQEPDHPFIGEPVPKGSYIDREA